MFTWQYIDLPEKEIIKIQYDFKQSLPNNELFFQGLNITTRRFLSMPIYSAVLIQVPPGAGLDHSGIHHDVDSTRLAINIPLDNCEESITSFWQSWMPAITDNTPNGYSYAYYDPRYCRKIDEFKLTRPIIFDTSVPHNVGNPTDKWRRAISLRFKPDPWHLINNTATVNLT